MAAKTGEIVYLPVTLQTSAGAAQTYATKALLLAAGFSFGYWVNGVVVASPTWTWTVVDGATGRHEIGLTVEAGQGEAYLAPPAGFVVNVESYLLDIEDVDLDALYGAIITTDGVTDTDLRATTFDFSVTEGDTLQRVLTIPLVALSDYGLTDLSTLATISGAGRTRINRIDTSPDFTIGVAVVDATARTVALHWSSFPTGASISGFTITAVSVGSKTFTVAGDKRSFFDGITTLLIANSTGNDGTYTVTAMALTGGATVFTVSETIVSSTADGTLAQSDDSKDFLYDVQATFPSTFAITAVSSGSKQFTISGNRQRWFNVGGTFTVTGSTGNDGTYTVTTIAYSTSTVLTVSETVPSAVADGSVKVTFKITGLNGTITVSRQEDRT